MKESRTSLSALRRSIAALAGAPAEGPDMAAFGLDGIDAVLGGGLARGRLHEVFAAQPEDAGGAAGFAAMLAVRAAPPARAILWLRVEEREARAGRLHALGLAELGLDPALVLLVLAADASALLRAAADVLRCPQVGVAVIDMARNARMMDLTVSRRLALAAEGSGVTALLLRTEATPMPSAAHTRWAVRGAASTPLEADAPGYPALEISLLRQRAGPSGASWRVEWDRDRRIFREAPLPGAVLPLPPRRSAAGGRLRA